MATNLGKAYVQIMPSAKGISGMISKELDGEVKSAGQSAGNSLISTIKNAILASGIGKLFATSLFEGGKLQQSLGGVETLFKNNAETVKQYANEAYKTTGLSANAYMENVTGFSASLLQSLGGDTAKAAKIANMACFHRKTSMIAQRISRCSRMLMGNISRLKNTKRLSRIC